MRLDKGICLSLIIKRGSDRFPSKKHLIRARACHFQQIRLKEAQFKEPAMLDDSHQSTPQSDKYERPWKPAVLRGWQGHCPNCGTGAIFSGYLKVNATCPNCNEALHHHRADDGPAYMTILIVGHVMAPLFLFVFTHYRPTPLVLATIFSVGTIMLSLYLLPRLKGALVALQWAKRIHGFSPEPA